VKPFTAKLPDNLIDAGHGVDLQALCPADEPFLDRLLQEPDVAEWFDADASELIDLTAEPTVTPFLIRRSGIAIGYAQVYHANADTFWRGHGMPQETMGIDLAIGGQSNRGQGIGPLVIRALTARVFAMEGVVQTIIDPHPDNARAIRAYTTCGFRFSAPQSGYYGDPMALGILTRSNWIHLSSPENST
jgi:aminoglycoside 6'-N-acetyltransferase